MTAMPPTPQPHLSLPIQSWPSPLAPPPKRIPNGATSHPSSQEGQQCPRVSLGPGLHARPQPISPNWLHFLSCFHPSFIFLPLLSLLSGFFVFKLVSVLLECLFLIDPGSLEVIRASFSHPMAWWRGVWPGASPHCPVTWVPCDWPSPCLLRVRTCVTCGRKLFPPIPAPGSFLSSGLLPVLL